MIELGGTRYAVGPGAVRLFAVAALLASGGAACHAALWGFLWARPGNTDVGFVLLMLVIFSAVFVGIVLQLVSTTIGAAVSQKIVAAEGPDHPSRSWRITAVTFNQLILMVVISGIAPILPLLASWAAQRLQIPRTVLTIPTQVLAVAISLTIAALLWRLHNQLRRQARRQDSGGWIDLFHGWDWGRVDTDELRVFKNRHGILWKPPTEVTKTAEAISYATTARTRRGMALLVATLMPLIGAIGGLDALKWVIRHAVALKGTDLPTVQGYGQIYGLGIGLAVGLGIFVVIPWMLRTKVDDLRDLAAAYDDRAKELRTGTPAAGDTEVPQRDQEPAGAAPTAARAAAAAAAEAETARAAAEQ